MTKVKYRRTLATRATIEPDAYLIDLVERMQVILPATMEADEAASQANSDLIAYASSLYIGPLGAARWDGDQGEPLDKTVWRECLDAANAAFADRISASDQAMEEAYRAQADFEIAACGRPALTLAGLIAKAGIATFNSEGCEPNEDVAASIVKDLLAMAEQVRS